MLLGLLGLSAAAALTTPDPARACAPAPPGPVSAGAGDPRPTAPAAGCVTPDSPRSPRGGVDGRLPLPWLVAEPGQPVVADSPATLTGSAVTMTGLRLEGIVDLPIADGTLRTLKFTMEQAVIDDALLRSPGRAGRGTRLATRRLTVQGKVVFYVTRFTGRLHGVEFTLTPDLAYAIPVASTSPVTVTHPAIDLAFVTADVLAAGPRLQLTPGGP
ncbi:hypothetical protein [Micromonospora sp. NPDC126480]|uniref:hypothetical protein n=1 Tax=Micromonospora sp. NPDC126480 TaxID=3155312 RepID=UPI00331B039A